MILHGIMLKGFFRRRAIGFPATALWLALSLWTTLSLSTAAAQAFGIFRWLPAVDWFRAVGSLWTLCEPFLISAIWMGNAAPHVDPGRRELIRCAAVASVSAPVSGALYGFAIARRDARVREVELPFVGLPVDLHNLRMVQITDIHLGSFFSRSQLRRVVSQANELRPHLAFVTGDLITSYGDPLDDAILELSRLSSDAGTYGCLGNHEILAEAEDYATAQGERAGLRFLRGKRASLRFGSARLNLAGVDYQRMGSHYLAGAERLVHKDEFNLLLSHNPDVFPVAGRQGWDLTLSGHTHGGQITLEYLHPSLNPARFFTPFTQGVYRTGDSALYVCRGLGTIGLPMRFGAEPEIGLIRLVPA